jgi:cell division protein FtsI/penicillin-binding protein 2
MARGFGLGEITGIEGVEEQSGNIPTPASEVDAINSAGHKPHGGREFSKENF